MRCERTMLYMLENRFQLFDVSMSLICKSIQKIKSEIMQSYGLKSSHVLFMVQLGEQEDGLTASELSRAGHMDKAQISRVVSELTDKGYITKCSGTGQKYRNKFKLTEAGRRITKDLDLLIEKAFEYVSGSIPKADLDVFYRTLFTISDKLFSLTEEPDALGAVN